MRFAEELELVPYQTAFPPGQRWLVLAPHPDDETFGLGATLAQAGRKGVSLRVVVLTGGEAQGESPIRREETQAALHILGVPDGAFWGFQDRKLAACVAGLAQAIRRELTSFRPEVVFAPHAADLHPDHRACARALQLALRRQLLFGWRKALPAWVAFYEIGIPLWPNLLVTADEGWEAKEKAFACYASQLSVRPYHRVMAGLAAFRALTVEGASCVEAFQLHPARRVAAHSWRWLARRALGPLPPAVLAPEMPR